MDAFPDTAGHTPAPAYAYAGSDLPVASAFAPDPRVGGPLTSRREMFCRCYVAFGNAAEAARRAGYADGAARQTGHRLLADDTIQARIEALWAHAEGVRETDRDLLVDKIERLFEASLADKGYNAAARALTLQARLAGFGGPASEREPVVPGRPGPIARAQARKAARAAAGDADGACRTDGGGASAEQRARQAGAGGVDGDHWANDGGPAKEQGARQGKTAPAADAGGPPAEAAPAASDAAAAGAVSARQAPASRPAAVTPWQQTAAEAAPPSARQALAPIPAAIAPWQQDPAEAGAAVGADPWAEATRIDRQRARAALDARLAAGRRRLDRAAEADRLAMAAEAGAHGAAAVA